MKRLNNKGFTVLEVMLSFVLVMIVLINMFTIIMTYRAKAQEEVLKADYLSFKSMVTKDIQTDILNRELDRIEELPASTCGEGIERCIQFVFRDHTTKNLFIHNIQTTSEVRNKYLQYGDQKYRIRDDIPEDTLIPSGKTALDYQTVDIYQGRMFETSTVDGDTVYAVHISIHYDGFQDDYGIHIVSVPNFQDKTIS